MDETLERSLGRLEARQEETLRRQDETLRRLESIDQKFDGEIEKVNAKISELEQFRWKLTGYAMAASMMVSVAFELIRLGMNH